MKAAIVKTNFVSDVNERLHYTSVYLAALHSGRQQTSIRGGSVLGSCLVPALLWLCWEPAHSWAGNHTYLQLYTKLMQWGK